MLAVPSQRFEQEMAVFEWCATRFPPRVLSLMSHYADIDLLPSPHEPMDGGVSGMPRPLPQMKEVDRVDRVVAQDNTVWASDVRVLGDPTAHHYIAKKEEKGAGTRGCRAAVLTTDNLQTIPGVLPLLRRQQLWNRLYQSIFGPPCFMPPTSSSSSSSSLSMETTETTAFEFAVTANPPCSLSVALCGPLAAKVGSGVVILSLEEVQGGGWFDVSVGFEAKAKDGDAHMTSNTNPLPFPSSFATAVLRRCWSVPVLMHYLVQHVGASPAKGMDTSE